MKHVLRRDFLLGASSIALAFGIPIGPWKLRAGINNPGGAQNPSGSNQIGLNGIAYFNGIHPFANWLQNGDTQQVNPSCPSGISTLTAAQPSGTCTITIAANTPAVFNATGHDLYPGATITLSTTGALPSPFVAGTTYYVTDYKFAANTFTLQAAGGGNIPLIATGSQSGIHSFLSVWSGYATTTGNHGLYQADVTGGLSITPYQNSFWRFTVTCSGNTNYNVSPTFGCGITSSTKFAYPLASNANPGAASGKLSFSYQLNDNVPPNSPGSLLGLNGNPNTFLDSDCNILPNAFPLATSYVYQRIYQVLALAQGAVLPNGYTRRGQSFTFAYTPLGRSAITSTFTWSGAQDAGTSKIVVKVGVGGDTGLTSLATPPRNMYLGLTSNYSNWLTAVAAGKGSGYFEPALLAELQNTCGCIRFMDWQNTNGTVPAIAKFSDIAANTSLYWGCHPWTVSGSAIGITVGPQVGMPIGVMASLANAVNKHPWINIPGGMHGCKRANAVSISRSSPAVLTTQQKHNFQTGDTVIIWSADGTGATGGDIAGWGQSSSVTVNVATSTIAYTSHGLLAGQPVVLYGRLPTGVVSGRNYYVCNPAANTFQLAISAANGVAGTALTLSGSASGVSVVAGINRCGFTVGAVTDTTMVLTTCSTVNFGTQPIQVFACTTPFSQAAAEAEATSFFNAVKSSLNSNITPFFENSNETWNTIFPTFSLYSALARNFVDASGAPIVGNPNGNQNMQGYIFATMMKICRDVFGGGATGVRPWKSRLMGQLGVPSALTSCLQGVQQYLANTASSLLMSDLIDDVGTSCYTGTAFQSDGFSFSQNDVTISTTSSAKVTYTGSNPVWAGAAFVLQGSGTMPTDLASGQPLSKQNAPSAQVAITASIKGGMLNVISGSGIVAGMTVYGQQKNSNSNGAFMSGVVSCVIQPFGTGGTTGVGGTGTYATDVVQTVPSQSMNCYDPTLNSQVYYLLETTSPFRFASSVNHIQGSISGNTLTVTQGASLVKIGDVIFQPLNAQNVNPADIRAGTTITGGSGSTWTLSNAISGSMPVQNLTTGTPINLQNRSGSGPFNLLSANMSFIQRLMVLSRDNWKANSGIYPSQYTYYDQALNYESQNNSATGTGNIISFNGLIAQVCNVLSMAGPGGTSLMPAVGMTFYEGGPGNNPDQPNAHLPNGLAPSNCGTFQEFVSQACGTVNEAAGWTLLVNTIRSAPGQTYRGVTIPANFRITYPSLFTDAAVKTSQFQFGKLSVLDSGQAQGFEYGSPSILNWTGAGAYPGPFSVALQGTN